MPQTAPPTLMLSLARYLQHGTTAVSGWLWPTAGAMLAQLLTDQAAAGLTGDVCEIGVHQGKSFLVLANATVGAERAVAVDVFGEQHKNIDQSGHGDRALFELNLAGYAPGATVDIIDQSSLELAATGFLDRRFRFFSIDGSHTTAATTNDLWLAERTALPGCIVALDDVLSPSWTGVLSGLVAYAAAGGALVPFALIPNKLLLTTDPAWAARYQTQCRANFALAVDKLDVEFLAGSVDSFTSHDYYDYENLAGLHQQVQVLRSERDKLAADYSELNTYHTGMEAAFHGLQAELVAAGSVASELAAVRSDITAERAEMASKVAAERAWMQSTITALQAERTQAQQQADRSMLAEAAACRQRDDLARQVAAVHARLSWRVTAPLRWLAGAARR